MYSTSLEKTEHSIWTQISQSNCEHCAGALITGHLTVTESTVYSSVHQSKLSRTIGWKWVIQQNNDPHHSNTFTTEWLKKWIKMLQWPSQSAELHPTNLLWCRFKRAVHKQMNQSDLHIIVVQNSSTVMWGNKVLLMNIAAEGGSTIRACT